MNRVPQAEHIELVNRMSGALPSDAKLGVVIYPHTLWVPETPSIELDLPSIGANGIDPELLRSVTPRVTERSSALVVPGLWFVFYAFKDGKPWTAESDRRPSDVKRAAYEYTLVAPAESPPFIIQYIGMYYGNPEEVTKHEISPEEAKAFGDAIVSLTPRPW